MTYEIYELVVLGLTVGSFGAMLMFLVEAFRIPKGSLDKDLRQQRRSCVNWTCFFFVVWLLSVAQLVTYVN